MPNEWHFVHLGSRAVGGAALVCVEASGVTPEGRITPVGRGHLVARRTPRRGSRSRDFIRAHGAVPGDPDRARGTQGVVRQAVAGRQAARAARGRLDSRSGRARSPSASYPRAARDDRGGDRGDRRRHFARAARLRARRRLRRGRDPRRARLPAAQFLLAALEPAHATTTAARSRTACACRSRSRARCAPRGRRTSPCSTASRRPTGSRAAGTSRSRSSSARRLKDAGIDLIDCSSGGNIHDAEDRARPRLPGAVRRGDPARGRHPAHHRRGAGRADRREPARPMRICSRARAARSPGRATRARARCARGAGRTPSGRVRSACGPTWGRSNRLISSEARRAHDRSLLLDHAQRPQGHDLPRGGRAPSTRSSRSTSARASSSTPRSSRSRPTTASRRSSTTRPPTAASPISVFESGAILLYLAGKTGQFIPKDLRGQVETLEWLMWQMGGLGPMAGQNHHFTHYAPEKLPYAIDRYVKETLAALRRAQQAPRRAATSSSASSTPSPTWPPIRGSFPERQGQDIDDFPNLKRWHAAIRARPATDARYARAKEVNPPARSHRGQAKILFARGQDRVNTIRPGPDVAKWRRA